MARPLIESLEPRSLFAAAPLPDLTATLNYTPPAVVRPGTTITPSLTITNIGAPITKSTKVPIRLFVSTTPTLDPGAQPFKISPQPLALQHNQSTTITLKAPLPATVKTQTYYFIVQVNNKKALKETSLTNNIAISKPLANPAGTYTGDFTSSDGRSGSLTLKLSNLFDKASSTSPLFTDFTDISDGVRITRTHLRSRLSTAGDYVVTHQGSYDDPTLGHVTYNLSLRATLSNNKTLKGTFHLAWHTVNTSRNSTSTFTATRL